MNLLTAFAIEKGVSHKVSDTPCQDSVIVKQDDGYLFVGLADGAGSCKHSDIGSKSILQFLSVDMRINFDYYNVNEDEARNALLEKIHLALDSIARFNEVKIQDLSSTLLCMVVHNDTYLIIHIGDGVIGMLDSNDNLSVLSNPENGEYVNYTYFTTCLDPEKVHIYRGNIQDLNGLVLMSDGVEESLYHYRTKSLMPITKDIIKLLDDYTPSEVSSILDENLKNAFAIKSSDDLSIAIIRHHKNTIKEI